MSNMHFLLRAPVKNRGPDCPDLIIGLDLSLTSTGLCSIHRDAAPGVAPYAATFCTNIRQGSDWHRQNLIMNGILDTVTRLGGIYKSVVIEDYTMGRNSGKNYARVELHGMVRRGLQEIGCAVYKVPPGTLKKWVAGSGAADKDAMAGAAILRWGASFDTSDETDAFALAKYGAAMLWDNLPLVAEKLTLTLSDMA